MPTISTPHPKIINPNEANLAEAGKEVQKEFNEASKLVPTKNSLIA
ncbi:hypothetical protein SDC9_164533 [bioreactor metagenome]|uniref:Uncharacterized protein n=1 Tax=bioreactor metagenome TaxID=1076179 RepID=A0A645FZ43_9ZZZZ